MSVQEFLYDRAMLKSKALYWRIEIASKASIIIDADNYFAHAKSAMEQAQQRIVLIGWDFDTRIALTDPRNGSDAQTLGDFIYGLVKAKPELEIYILRWRFGAFKALFRGTNIFTLLKWMWHKHIHTKLDSVHPPGASHHQKIAIIDDDFAFCGGIDMTGDRWDTRDHLDHNGDRTRPNGKEYGPWHDATSALQGSAASALAELARYRWERAGGKTIGPLPDPVAIWPVDLAVQFEDVEVGIARTEPEMDDREAILEIENLYLDQIANAKKFIYAENQYFASRRIAKAMSLRLQQPDCPEIVIICPESAEGWLEPIAMDSARARLFQALHKVDANDKLRIYHPVTQDEQPIYVHAKILIVDDTILRIGSANMNNRSLRLDTECDISIDAARAHNSDCSETIRTIRLDLLAEHLDMGMQEFHDLEQEHSSIIAAIEQTISAGRSLKRYVVPDLSQTEKFVADNEVLDPEGPGESFEPFAKRSLFRGILKRSKG